MNCNSLELPTFCKGHLILQFYRIEILNLSEGGYDKRIMIWNINEKMAKIPIKGHQDWVTVRKFLSKSSILIDEDGFIASLSFAADYDKIIQIHEIDTKNKIQQIHFHLSVRKNCAYLSREKIQKRYHSTLGLIRCK